MAVTIDGSTGLLIVNGQKLFPLRLSDAARQRGSRRQRRVAEIASAGASFIRAGAAIWNLQQVEAKLKPSESSFHKRFLRLGGGGVVRELDSPCKLADSGGRTEFMHPTGTRQPAATQNGRRSSSPLLIRRLEKPVEQARTRSPPLGAARWRRAWGVQGFPRHKTGAGGLHERRSKLQLGS